MDMKQFTCRCLSDIRAKAPLVHNITNFVVMNSSANILLALGASPVMAHAREEAADMASLASALVLNIGTLEKPWVESMILAAKTANTRGIPVILDPVGAGATPFRTKTVKQILSECHVDVIRGNVSEVLAIWNDDVTTRGVDSSCTMSNHVSELLAGLAKKHGIVLAVSGEEDCITDGTQTYRVKNGHALMTKVTGLGCGLSAVVASFVAVHPFDLLCAVTAAFGFYGLCGEQAASTAANPGSFSTAFIDSLYGSGEAEIMAHLRIEGPF